MKKKLTEDPYTQDLTRMIGLAGIKPLNSVTENTDELEEQELK